MKSKKVYLTFPTDPETSFLLKELAHKMGKTQPDLINEICKDFVKNLLSYLEEQGNYQSTPAPGQNEPEN